MRHHVLRADAAEVVERLAHGHVGLWAISREERDRAARAHLVRRPDDRAAHYVAVRRRCHRPARQPHPQRHQQPRAHKKPQCDQQFVPPAPRPLLHVSCLCHHASKLGMTN